MLIISLHWSGVKLIVFNVVILFLLNYNIKGITMQYKHMYDGNNVLDDYIEQHRNEMRSLRWSDYNKHYREYLLKGVYWLKLHHFSLRRCLLAPHIDLIYRTLHH